MLRFLRGREDGSHRPWLLSHAELTRRTFSLELSTQTSISRTHRSGVNALDIDCVECRYLLSACNDGSVYVHDIDANTTMDTPWTAPVVIELDTANQCAAHRHSVESVQWYSQDTGLFTTGSVDGYIRIWDANAPSKASCEYRVGKPIYCHTMRRSSTSNAHALIAIGSADPKVRLCDLRTGGFTHVLRGHREAVLAATWDPRHDFSLVTGAKDGRIMVWDVRSAGGPLTLLDQCNSNNTSGGKGANSHKETPIAHNGIVNGLSFTPDGLWMVSTGSDKRVRLWDMHLMKNSFINYGSVRNNVQRGLQLGMSPVGCIPELLFHPTGNDISVLDIRSGHNVGTLSGHYARANACSFHPYNGDLYTGGNDHTVLVWTAPSISSNSDVGDTTRICASSSMFEDNWSDDD